jgi:CheY-like chemotaxis protein/two-component sensor histidine kinase
MIERQLAQMVRLVDDLLDVSRIATGKLKLHRDVLRLDEVVERAVETSRPRIDAQGHRLFVHLPHEPVRVRGDAVRLAQVLTNLLNNAAKYTDPGGTIVVQVRAPADGRVAIEVRDTGIGLAPEALAGVFDLFAQVETAEHKAQGGLGIGLTIARRIVELHGGTIRVASEGLGRGATFTVELPVADPVAAPAVADGPGERRHSQCRVVVADDNRDTADSLAIMLRLSGHEVHVAYDGEAAVELVRRHRPDVALVDIGMPRLDGYGVARHLRAEPWGGALVLAALTGWGQHSDRDAAAAAGFDHHFTKPVDPAAVEALLNGLPHCSRPASWTRLAAGE